MSILETLVQDEPACCEVLLQLIQKLAQCFTFVSTHNSDTRESPHMGCGSLDIEWKQFTIEHHVLTRHEFHDGLVDLRAITFLP